MRSVLLYPSLVDGAKYREVVHEYVLHILETGAKIYLPITAVVGLFRSGEILVAKRCLWRSQTPSIPSIEI